MPLAYAAASPMAWDLSKTGGAERADWYALCLAQKHAL